VVVGLRQAVAQRAGGRPGVGEVLKQAEKSDAAIVAAIEAARRGKQPFQAV
jgi:hypothetical protein